MFGKLRLSVGDIDDAGPGEAGIAADQPVHILPEPHAFESERDLAGVAAHDADPAPVAAGLLMADLALLADRDRDPIARQEQCCGDADDAAADDDDVAGGRQGRIGLDGLDGDAHHEGSGRRDKWAAEGVTAPVQARIMPGPALRSCERRHGAGD